MAIENVYMWIALIAVTHAAMICNLDTSPLIYRKPDDMECKHDVMTHLAIKIEQRNKAKYKLPAKALKVEQKTCKTYVSLVGAKVTNKASTILKLERDEAQRMISQHSCVNDVGGYRIHPLINDYECDYSYLKHKTTTTQSCHHYKGTIFIDHQYNMISGVANMAGCKYEKEYCATSDGTQVVWQRQDQVEQDFLLVGVYNATLVGNHLAIPALAMTLKIDNGNMQKLISAEPWEQDNLKITKILQSPTLQSEDDMQDDIDKKLQYLLDIMNSPKANQKFNCDIHRELIKLRWELAKVNPTFAARALLNQSNIVATSTEDYLMVYPCKRVYQYRHKNTAGCWLDSAIEYKLNEHSKYEDGFLKQDGTITKSSLQIRCRSVHSYAQNNNTLYRVTANGWSEVAQKHIKRLIISANAEGLDFPQDYPDKAWISNGSDAMQSEDWALVLEDRENRESESLPERATMNKYSITTIIFIQWLLIITVGALLSCEIKRQCNCITVLRSRYYIARQDIEG